MNDVVIQPLLAGLSTGLFCCVTCLPFLAPYLVAEERTFGKTVKVMAEFVLGRLVGYAAFGGVVGYLGERMNNSAFNIVSLVSLILLAAALVLYAAGLLQPKSAFCGATAGFRVRAPWLLGLLLGANICPPFLMSVAYVFTLHSMAKGIVYFLVFFAATTLYFIPLVFLGFLSRMSEFRLAARVSAVAVGLVFIVYGMFALGRGTLILHNL